MGFYQLSKPDRVKLVEKISSSLLLNLKNNSHTDFDRYFSDEDTYIRKSAYLAVGRIYNQYETLRKPILKLLDFLLQNEDFKIRQTTINAAGEIGMSDFESVVHFFEKALFDIHHSVRNAVIGSIKKMGEKNPIPVLAWSKKYLKHPDKEIRREICHGIELRGRTHPQDILPMLKVLQHDKEKRVSSTLVHVLGQISYKKGCLQTVIVDLNKWENQELVKKAVEEIIDVHDRYKDFAILTQEQAISYINENYHPNKS
jgi:HEAT repeat protein